MTTTDPSETPRCHECGESGMLHRAIHANEARINASWAIGYTGLFFGQYEPERAYIGYKIAAHHARLALGMENDR